MQCFMAPPQDLQVCSVKVPPLDQPTILFSQSAHVMRLEDLRVTKPLLPTMLEPPDPLVEAGAMNETVPHLLQVTALVGIVEDGAWQEVMSAAMLRLPSMRSVFISVFICLILLLLLLFVLLVSRWLGRKWVRCLDLSCPCLLADHALASHTVRQLWGIHPSQDWLVRTCVDMTRHCPPCSTSLGVYGTDIDFIWPRHVGSAAAKHVCIGHHIAVFGANAHVVPAACGAAAGSLTTRESSGDEYGDAQGGQSGLQDCFHELLLCLYNANEGFTDVQHIVPSARPAYGV